MFAVRQLLDLMLVVAGASIAYALVPDIDHRLFDARGMLIALDVALVTLIFPTLNIYQSWRGKSALSLTVHALAGWGLVQAVGLVIYAVLPHTSPVPHSWLVQWTAMTAALFVV